MADERVQENTQEEMQEKAQQDTQPQPEAGNPNGMDPLFFECVNEYLEVTNRQSQQYGLKRISLASMFAASRFNAHVYLASVKPIHAASERKDFLEYMSTMYRRMLNEHLDGMGEERGIDVGESELAAEYAAAGLQIGNMKSTSANDDATPANEYVSAAGAVPPATPSKE